MRMVPASQVSAHYPPDIVDGLVAAAIEGDLQRINVLRDEAVRRGLARPAWDQSLFTVSVAELKRLGRDKVRG